MTRERAMSVIMLMVKPTTYMKKNVAMTDVGRASAVMSVERQSRMKMKTISTAMMPPNTMCPRTSRTFSRMPSASLCTCRMDSCGKVGASLARASSTLVAMSTVLAPDCLRMENETASAPSRRVVDDFSAKPSTTVATSRTRTVEPPVERRMTFSISPEEANSPLVRSDTARPSRLTWPPGTSRFSAVSLAATSVRGRLRASRRLGSRLTWISRTSPPLTCTAATPSICSSSGFRSSSI